MDWVQYVSIGAIVLLLGFWIFSMSRKNKAENQKMIEQTNSLKKGDEIITNAGIYGKIIEVRQDGEAKKVVIETGNDKNKSFLTIDAYAIYAVLNKDKEVKENKVEPKKEEQKKVEPEVKKEEAKESEVKEEKAQEDSNK